MPRMSRRNYLIPRELLVEVRRLVKSGRFKTESEAVRASLQKTVVAESQRVESLTRELDLAAEETARHITKAKTAGELIHEAHVEEAHWT